MVFWSEFSQLTCPVQDSLLQIKPAIAFYFSFHPTLPQVEGFEVYTTYGGNHENAQKLVFELEKDPVIKGFFTVSSLTVGVRGVKGGWCRIICNTLEYLLHASFRAACCSVAMATPLLTPTSSNQCSG